MWCVTLTFLNQAVKKIVRYFNVDKTSKTSDIKQNSVASFLLYYCLYIHRITYSNVLLQLPQLELSYLWWGDHPTCFKVAVISMLMREA